MKNDLWNSLLFNLLTGLTAFLFVPIIMIGNNPEDYAFIEIFTLLKYGLLHSILLGLCLSTLSFLLCFFKGTSLVLYKIISKYQCFKLYKFRLRVGGTIC